jgi:hypothetical protein
MVGLDIEDGTHGPLANEYEGQQGRAVLSAFALDVPAAGGDPEGKHGLSPHGILGDEVWEWKNGLLHRHLQKSGLAPPAARLHLLVRRHGQDLRARGV